MLRQQVSLSQPVLSIAEYLLCFIANVYLIH